MEQQVEQVQEVNRATIFRLTEVYKEESEQQQKDFDLLLARKERQRNKLEMTIKEHINKANEDSKKHEEELMQRFRGTEANLHNQLRRLRLQVQQVSQLNPSTC
jgi:hypothetical protein